MTDFEDDGGKNGILYGGLSPNLGKKKTSLMH